MSSLYYEYEESQESLLPNTRNSLVDVPSNIVSTFARNILAFLTNTAFFETYFATERR